MADTNMYEVAAAGRTILLKSGGLRAEGYTGKNRFMVSRGTDAVQVYAKDTADAIWAAAKHWGVDPRKAEFHQNCRVRKC